MSMKSSTADVQGGLDGRSRGRLNFIYVVCHDLGKHLGVYGHPVGTPSLDAFAEEGVCFTNAFCNSPACSPSRGCAMSGMHAHSNGLMGLVNRGWSLPETTRTVVDHLNDAGYDTVHCGFQHERYSADANRYKLECHKSPSDIYCEKAIDDAIGYLASRDGNSPPFYVNIGTHEVHPTGWQGNFDDGRRLSAYGDTVRPDEVFIPDFIPDTPAVREEMRKRQASIRHLDRSLKTLLAYVDAHHREDTVVIFTTDHGMPAHRAKPTLYDRGVEISLLIRMPGGFKGNRRIGSLIQNIDFMPTILDAAGIPVPRNAQGKSFWPLLAEKDYERNRQIFLERNFHDNYDPIRAVRTDRFKYIRNFDLAIPRLWLPSEVSQTAMKRSYARWYDEMWPAPAQPREPEELYDLADDPGETSSLAANPAYSDIKASLSESLEAWMQTTDDPLLHGPIPDKKNGWPEDIDDREFW